MAKRYTVEESAFSHFLFNTTAAAWFWLVVRLYLGWQWIEAGWEKVTSPAWTGSQAGTALSGFLQGSLQKTAGAHPDVQSWYAVFLRTVVLAHPVVWSHIVSYGELLVGIALVIGFLTGIAAFFGLFMNLNYLLAGAVSTNPILFVLAVGTMLAWKVAGYIGADRYVLPVLRAASRTGAQTAPGHR
ncbi:MAG: DoxX family membrane protein [Patescibacteria group bacterium]|nr:DoxX family membrane protein [Patescibacteria group bacterium]MDE2116555.1 DoxX family membrane protein [Patescibacteria group bacterium]